MKNTVMRLAMALLIITGLGSITYAAADCCSQALPCCAEAQPCCQ